MKVLYIGNYKDGTGWGNAAKNNILALNSAGVDVVARPICYNNKNLTDPRLESLESKNLSGVDVCIQHSLPPTYKYKHKVKNIALYYTETSNWQHTLWHKYINLLDEAWVSSRHEKNTSFKSGVKVPIKVFKNCIDYNSYQNIQCDAKVKELKDGFNFCFFGEFNTRKNISSLLRAYHSAFHYSENVNLFLKLHDPTLSPQATLDKAKQLNEFVQQNMRTRKKFKEVYIMTGYMNHNDYLSVMSQCHCMVVPSFGEACCIPILEAHALGLEVIYNDHTGMFDYGSDAYSYKVDSREVPCYGATNTLPELYSSLDNWYQINIESLGNTMRKIYDRYLSRSETDKLHIQNEVKKHAQKYDLKVVGLEMKEMLECQ